MEMKVYGDHFNADTRAVLNVLNMCKVDNKLIEIDTLAPEDSPERKAFRTENPANSFPMLIHGQFKIMSNLEYILKYLSNAFPQI